MDLFLVKGLHAKSQHAVLDGTLGILKLAVAADDHEPVSALDVSVHAQILNLLMEMQEKTQTTYLFISHNLAAVKKLCSRLAIMYLGKVVEYGDAAKIFANPVHPYTKALLSAVLTVNPNEETKRIVLKGDVTSPINPLSGCRFCSRCYQAQEDCADRECVLTEVEAE